MSDKKPLVLDATGEYQQIQAGDTIGVAFGGTGAATAAAARANLGLTIGQYTQAWGASLDAVQALNTTGAVIRTGADTFTTRTLVAPASGIAVANGDGVLGNPTLSLANDLGAVEALSGIGFGVRIATDTWAQRSIAVQPRLTVVNPDGSTGNPTLDLATVTNAGGGSFLKFTQDTYGRITGTSAVATSDLTGLLNTTYLSMITGGSMQAHITLFADPTQAMHPATKQYVDAIKAGQAPKAAVKALSTTNVNIANPGIAVFDGVTLVAGDRLLLVGNTAQAENGPWVFNGSGVAMTRPVDFDQDSEVVTGSTFFVDQGTANDNSNWTLINSGPYTLGTSALVFTQTNGLGQINAGNGMSKAGNTISAAITARLAFNAGNIDLAAGIAAAGTYTKVTVDTYGRVVGTATATPADIGAQTASTELTGVSALAATGIVVRTAAGAYAPRTITGPATGLIITNGNGVGGNPTIALANDLAALEGLAGTGFATRTGADAYAQRAMTGSGRIVVTNGDGVAGAPTFDLTNNVVAAGTYQSVTVDAYGRVVAGSTSIATGLYNGSILTNNEVASVVIGSPVYGDGADTFKKAVANNATTADVTGLVFATTAGATQGIVVTSGEMAATAAQWDAITGQTGGLTPNARYYLDNTTAGRMTTTPPSSGYVAPVGKAMSPTRFLVRVGNKVQL